MSGLRKVAIGAACALVALLMIQARRCESGRISRDARAEEQIRTWLRELDGSERRGVAGESRIDAGAEPKGDYPEQFRP